MIVFHAIWTNATLHLWGEHCSAEDAARGRELAESAAQAEACGSVSPGSQPPLCSSALAEEVLRRSVGDVYDSLLVSGAASSELTLRLPHRNGRPVPSVVATTSPAVADRSHDILLVPCRVPTLAFAPADAVDLLTASPGFGRGDVHGSTSLCYWSRVAALVLELLAKQRFVPAVHHAGSDRYLGYWRVVVDDGNTPDRLGALIASMPPVCRSLVVAGEPLQASALVENFLWTTVDALVRRCLEGDELAHAVSDRPKEGGSPQMCWLRSVVRPEANLTGTPEQREIVFETVRNWLARLEPAIQERTWRTCFRLHAPSVSPTSAPLESGRRWRLTLHLQAKQDPKVVLDAARLADLHSSDPLILKRPFDNAREQLGADIAEAARHFPPLAVCAGPHGPLECHLTRQEAYAFLREAAPILESEGYVVWVPMWWHKDRPRLRMWLDIRPIDTQTPVGVSAMGLDAIVSYNWRVAVGDQELSPDEITQVADAAEPLVNLRGRWTEVQPSDIQAALSFLKNNRGGRMTVFEALRQCYIADDLETGLPVAGLRAHGWIEDFLSAADASSGIEHLSPPEGFRGQLRPYQLRGLEWLAFLTRLGLGACLADDMGLGKTIQLIALWLHERQSGSSPGPTLLVVPMSLVGNWRREIERFAPSLRIMVHHGHERLTGQEFVNEVARYDAVISTYGLIHRDLEHIAAVDWHRIALDEAQNIKNPAAKQAAAIRSLRAVHRVALTGTPVENRLSELWSIIEFLNTGYLGGATEFRRRFAVPIERYHDTDRAQRLRHLIRPFVLRRVKTDPDVEVDLPDKMEMKVFCNLTGEQAGLYENVVRNMLGQIDQAGGIQRRGLILAALVKLKQVCNHPAHFLADGSSLPQRSGKCERLTEMLEEVLAEGDRALVFTQFRVMGELLLRHLRETLGRGALFLHGGTSRTNRDAIVERFQRGDSDAPILILSLRAGGYGLNLTAANHVFHFDRWWNPAVEDQATDRAYRIGQGRHVQVHKFVCIGTLEERIDSLLEQKRGLADNVMGRGEEWLTGLSTEKLREVFALSREAVAED